MFAFEADRSRPKGSAGSNLVALKVEALAAVSLPGQLAQAAGLQVAQQQRALRAADQEAVLVDGQAADLGAVDCSGDVGRSAVGGRSVGLCR